MHHLITGIEPLPFKFEPLSKVIPGISSDLENIITKTLKDNLAERFNSAREMKTAIDGIGSSAPPVPAGVNNKKTVNLNISSVKNEMILIAGGTFQMGSDRGDNKEKPVHQVTVGSFYMSKYPVTNEEYKLFRQEHRSHWTGADYPVDSVRWHGAIDYCNWLSDKDGYPRCYIVTGNNIKIHINRSGYRLPTEAEWEYACRAGTITEYYWGDDMDDDYCWYAGNSANHAHAVGQKKSNPWGLYDMSGNVSEWCWDWYDENYYSKSLDYNPTGPSPAKGPNHVIRGGSWQDNAKICRSANRSVCQSNGNYLIGFRLARTA